ncbi:MAG: TIGR00730 family Rossman fold protein [Micromonosporaceae bacterium]|nr:TIGR00730 family Rossman fold protein [Micromonosporaceae bacterium]
MGAVCVFCASSTAIDPRWLELAREVGAGLAAAGHTLVSGGGRVGMMGTVAQGARAGGAHTLGVMAQVLIIREVADLDADELLTTVDLAERKSLMMTKADAFLVLPGGIGTLDELFEVWTTASLSMHAKPVVLLNVDGFYTGLLDWLRGLATAGFVRSQALDQLSIVETVDEALAALA